ncbi:MAG: peptidyl-prolyl cis-trans isomerase [Lachnospiraceae bacterium]|nr:peptidyl-prolyl cis-trans isomerase [Lachnospiraceae bacterium]
MKAKRLAALLLTVVLGASVLTGCGSGIDAKKTGATLDGQEISLGFMNFMARYQQAIYDGQFSSMFGNTDMWSQDMMGDGTDMETSVKKNVAESIEQFYLLEKHMADYKVEITDEEMTAMDEAAKKFMEDNTPKAIKQIGATEEYVKEMLRLNTIQAKMRIEMDKEVDTEVTDEEAAQKTISYVSVNRNSTTDEEGETKEYTEEEKAEVEQKVKDFRKAAKDDFETAAEAAGYTVTPYSYGEKDESYTLDDAVIEAANKLKDGGLSKVITTDDNYYVVHMDSTFDEEKTEEKKKSIVQQRKDDHYTEVCDGYKEGVTFELNEDEWAKVKFDERFTIKQTQTAEPENDAGEEDASGAENDAGGEDASDADETADTEGTSDNETGTEDSDSK